MREVLFLCGGAGAVLFGVLMVFQRSLYAAAACLLAALLQTAILLYLAGSPLLAFLQAVVSAGAVMVLIVFAIMSSRAGTPESPWARLSAARPLAAAGLALFAAELIALAARPDVPGGVAAGAPLDAAVGAVLFGPYAAATEAVALLLFVAALAVLSDPGSGRAGGGAAKP